ncbi:MAG: histidine--tRNA ligase [Legionella sp.]|uniref:histidine--tRNA ligase n=1 Tax=Legionella sp. TaxID=459 RepID=UPI00283F1D63|nr:histidine--tRNA ligase [Legionella sp.]
METKAKKLSLEPYKGTRDFYPREQFIQNYIFGVWRKVAESYGYLEYGASILEETDLYRAKSGEEIINEQTYSFTDRGGRDVTIRPEMTPTVARMVAQKRKELSFPLRWYSIPNLFRYERPQRGRLREHWQFNCDIFGVDSVAADVEIISLAYDIMKAFGAREENFLIKINSRKFLNYLADEYLQITGEQKHAIFKLIDRMNKISADEFEKQGIEILKEKFKKLQSIIQTKDPSNIPGDAQTAEGLSDIFNLITQLKRSGVTNVIFDPTIMRGFDYYTGTVFEMYDTNPKNPRALFGGGRYDDLVGIFGVEKVSGIGFGWGDVTTRDFLETYNLLPEYKPPVQLYIAHLENYIEAANQLAGELRKQGINVEVDLTNRQVSKQVKTADKENIPYILVVGEEEIKTGSFKIKNLKQSEEITVSRNEIAKIVSQTK